MLFNSLQFLLFFPIVTIAYFSLPHRFRWQLLLLASCLFYMAFIPRYILILAVLILINYSAAIWLEKPGISARKRKTILALCIAATCLTLFVFKYFNFFNTNFAVVARFFGWNYSIGALKIILPLGISFYTFQNLGYVIEVYWGHQKAERHIGIYALYVTFYPQLVAGPIERPQNLLHQFHAEHTFDYQRVTDGLKLMAWGLFKKAVIADRLAIAVNQVYGNPHDFTGWPLIVATIFFAFQIYCDFSGYSDIAIGSAQVMGFRLMDNFNRPYHSKSVEEFWKRWHISLSTWFRDYIYIPLGGNRTKTWRWQLNLFMTFLISGLWHGAGWGFVVWGALNGCYLILSQRSRNFRRSCCCAIHLDRCPLLHKLLRVAITFLLVCLAWVFFRAATLSDAWYILTHMFHGLHSGFRLTGGWRVLDMGLSRSELIVAVAAIVIMESFHGIQRHRHVRHMLSESPVWIRWSVYYVVTIGILLFGIFGPGQQFIYFQF
jgi:D-alanyl-lipoteichoic acid acyltransferase DltB (MBOAT superfamily)